MIPRLPQAHCATSGRSHTSWKPAMPSVGFGKEFLLTAAAIFLKIGIFKTPGSYRWISLIISNLKLFSTIPTKLVGPNDFAGKCCFFFPEGMLASGAAQMPVIDQNASSQEGEGQLGMGGGGSPSCPVTHVTVGWCHPLPTGAISCQP